MLQTQHQLSEAMLTLASTPLLDDYPHISVQIANLGGGLPFYLERLRAVAVDDPDDAEGRWRFQTGQMTVDSASFGPLALELARRALGADRVVLGTDMPIFDPARAVNAFRQGTEPALLDGRDARV